MATNENGSFAGRVACATGAGTGIGRAAALAFAREGANVAIADISEQGNAETARMIEEAGGRALAVACHVGRSVEVKAALDRTIEAFGRLDFALNNAGVVEAATTTAEMDEAEWDRVIDTDLRGVFLCMEHELPLMPEQGGGAIVNTSSGAGIRGFAGQPAYTSPPSTGWSASPNRRPSTTPGRTSASTPCAPGSSTPR